MPGETRSKQKHCLRQSERSSRADGQSGESSSRVFNDELFQSAVNATVKRLTAIGRAVSRQHCGMRGRRLSVFVSLNVKGACLKGAPWSSLLLVTPDPFVVDQGSV